MMLEDLVFAIQVGFIMAVILAIFVFVISTLNLLLDVKTRVLEAR